MTYNLKMSHAQRQQRHKKPCSLLQGLAWTALLILILGFRFLQKDDSVGLTRLRDLVDLLKQGIDPSSKEDVKEVKFTGESLWRGGPDVIVYLFAMLHKANVLTIDAADISEMVSKTRIAEARTRAAEDGNAGIVDELEK